MKQTFKTMIAAATVAAIVGAAGAASAQNTSVEAKCHAAIAKNVAKYQAGLVKNLAGCHKGRNAGKILASVNCNTATGADTKGKRGDNITKVAGAIAKACELDNPADTANVLALYPRCPSPLKTLDDAGLTTGIDTWAELANCLVQLSENYVNQIGTQMLGAPTALPLSKGQQACVNAQAKALGGLVKAATGINKCQAAQEKALMGLDLDATCTNDATVNGAVNEAVTALNAAIDDACGAENMPARTDFRTIGLCGETTAQQKTCAVTRVAKPVAQGLLAAGQEFPHTGSNLICAAGSADVIINAAYGDKSGTGKRTNSRLDAGWTGFSHDVDVVDQYKGRVLLTGCDADCEGCAVTIDTSAGNCRCENDATVECTTIGGADAACGGNTCQCMFGPPLALSAGGTPTCVVNRFSSDFSGTTGAIGEYDVTTATRALVHTGISQMQPCPTCGTNLSAAVGTASTCNGGLRNGLACTVDATHPVFGSSSFDCPPDSMTNISGAGLKLALQFKSGTASITAALNNPSFCASGTCHCSVCSGDALIGCSSDTECIDAGAGTCGANLGAGNPKANDCGGLACEVAADGMGTCDTGPMDDQNYDSFCSNALRGNGGGIIPCSVDADCDALDASCPGGDCGTCSLETVRSCFQPTVSATGTPGIFNSEGVSAFCNAATGNPGVNAAGGLPGPGRVRLDFDFNVWCTGGHTTQFNLPMGSNCP